LNQARLFALFVFAGYSETDQNARYACPLARNFPTYLVMNEIRADFYEGLEQVPRGSCHGVLARIASVV
jgi:hypothetical protein